MIGKPESNVNSMRKAVSRWAGLAGGRREDLHELKHIADAETVTSYDEASELLLRARELRMDKDADIAMMPLKADTLTVIFSDDHTQRRRIENSLFTRAALERLEFDVLDDALDRRLALVESLTRPEKLDLLQLARFCLLPVTARLVGLCPDGSDQWWTELSEYVRQFATAAAVQWKEGDASEVREQSLAVAQRFDRGIFDTAWRTCLERVNEHDAGRIAREELPSNLITLLLLHLPGRPRDVVLREVILYLLASTDSSTMAIASTLRHLHEWIGNHPGDASQTQDFGFLQRCVFEAIRLHPPPGLTRTAYNDMVLGSGRRVRAGQKIFIDIPVVNRDEAVFGPDAASFNPHREVRKGVQPYGFGFGGGAHKCIGRPLAVSHDRHGPGTTPADHIGAVVRIVHRIASMGYLIDDADPPALRAGWRQERYEHFNITVGRTAA